MDTKRVIIIGAGFGGLRAAKKLAEKPVRVTLIDRRNYHLFQPLLYQVATAGLSPDEIAYPLRAIFGRQKNLELVLAEVSGVDFEARCVHSTAGAFEYDALIIATGAAVNFFGNDSLARNALPLKDIGDAINLRNHVLKMFEGAEREPDAALRKAMLTFVVVGGGPTGVESAGAMSELIRLVLRLDYPKLNMSDVRVILVEAADALLSGFPAGLQENALRALASKHVEVRLLTNLSGYHDGVVTLANGTTIQAGTLLWSAGVRVTGLIDSLGLGQAKLGRVIVEPALNLAEYPEVYVIGDAAYFEKDGHPLPMMAPVAVQQADQAVENILSQFRGGQPESFIYRDPGSLATIGRNAAVARIGKWQFTGFPAWVAWLVVHLIGLIGFRNRLMVLINWAWDYLFYDRAVRLITKE